MTKRAKNGTRWIDGKLFEFIYAGEDRDYVDEVAEKVRNGEYPTPWGEAESYARVVKMNWTDMKFEREDGSTADFNRYAVYAFPKE